MGNTTNAGIDPPSRPGESQPFPLPLPQLLITDIESACQMQGMNTLSSSGLAGVRWGLQVE